ncbi:hypothetical protein FRB95_012328 [Tulasnella sp. JGI-2019a]|nr:hypothetical protein FRB95_012328 [Tulasnella sp. JGI-2019a]
MKAVEAHDRQISKGEDRRGLLKYHTEVLRYYRSTFQPVGGQDFKSHANVISQHLSRVTVHCRVPLVDQALAMEAWRDFKILSSWEERLSKDPLVEVETLQAELTAYATQLLLCLVDILPGERSDRGAWFTLEVAETLIDSVGTLQDRFLPDLYVLHALKVVNFVISEQSDPLNNLTQRFNSISPIFTRAFQSTSEDVLDAASGALAAFGGMVWDGEYTLSRNPEFSLPSEFGSAALRSLDNPAEKWPPLNDQSLSRWITASIRSNNALAATFDESTITSLFVLRLSRMLENENTGRDWETMWNVAYVFLKRWHSTAPNLDAENTPAMADAAIKSLVAFIRKRLWRMEYDTTNVEMFVFIADFVQQAFLLRPAEALLFELDIACEELIKGMKVWEENVRRKRDVDEKDTAREEAELATLVVPWAMARRAYAGPSRAWSESLRYPISAGWWKYGGLSRLCKGLGSTMV